MKRVPMMLVFCLLLLVSAGSLASVCYVELLRDTPPTKQQDNACGVVLFVGIVAGAVASLIACGIHDTWE